MNQSTTRLIAIFAVTCFGGVISGAGMPCVADSATSQLSAAAKSGDLIRVKELLAVPINVNAGDSSLYGRTALHEAAARGHKAVLALLLDHHADINARDANGRTALMDAAQFLHPDCLKLLLDRGAGVGNRGGDMGKALRLAANSAAQNSAQNSDQHTVPESGKEVIRLLIAKGANPYSPDEVQIPLLFQLASQNAVGVIDFMLQLKVSPNHKDKFGKNMLDAACQGAGDVELFDLLHRAGLKCSHDIKTCIQNAERGAKTRLLKRLCASANPSELTIADAPNEETAFFMLERGANVNKPCEVCGQGFPNDWGMTALHAAAKWNATRLIDALLKKGAKVDVQGKVAYKDTPLHLAAYYGNPEAVERLLKAGANPNIESAFGNALTTAVYAHNIEGFSKADTIKNQKYLKVMSLLVAAGADVHAINSAGESAADMVLKSQDPAFIEQARLALRLEKPPDIINDSAKLIQRVMTNQEPDGINAMKHLLKQQALSGQQVAAALTAARLNNLSSLSPLLEHSDSDIRIRALERINEIAQQRGDPAMRLRSEVYLQIEDSSSSTTLVDRKWFSQELMSSIIDATTDPEPRVRTRALRVLSIIDPVDSGMIELVTNKLFSDSDPRVRLRAAETLGWFATTQRTDLLPEIEKSIQSALINDGNCRVRLGAALVLQSLHQERQSNDSTTKQSEPTMLCQEFGIPEQMNAIRIEDTRKIPCSTDSLYRVCVVPDYCEKPIHIKLKLTVAAPRNMWPSENSGVSPKPLNVSADKKVATYEREFSGIGAYDETWQLDKEDRPGRYKLEVFLNDRLTKTFDFDLVASDQSNTNKAHVVRQ